MVAVLQTAVPQPVDRRPDRGRHDRARGAPGRVAGHRRQPRRHGVRPRGRPRRHVAAADRPGRVGHGACRSSCAALAIPLVRHGVAQPARRAERFTDLAERRADDPDSSARRATESGVRFLVLGAVFVPAQPLPRAVVAAPERLPPDRAWLHRRGDHGVHPRPRALRAASASCWAGDGPRPGAGGFTAMPGSSALGVFNLIFFAISGRPMWIGSLLAAMIGGLCVAPLGVLSGELFPTARRGGIQGWLTAIRCVGSAIGLLTGRGRVDRRARLRVRVRRPDRRSARGRRSWCSAFPRPRAGSSRTSTRGRDARTGLGRRPPEASHGSAVTISRSIRLP